MKRIVRKGVFESNSSSTHAICIATEGKLCLQPSLHFELDEFGWEWNSLSFPEEKASYLFTAIVHTNEDDSRINLPINEWHEIQWIKEVLERHEVEATFQDPTWKKLEFSDGYYLGYGYIDHGYELKDFLEDILSDEDMLMKYLFASGSYVQTGNDNSYASVDIHVKYPHKEYYKWN